MKELKVLPPQICAAREFSLWNPVKELKAEGGFGAELVSEGDVESGEGIES